MNQWGHRCVRLSLIPCIEYELSLDWSMMQWGPLKTNNGRNKKIPDLTVMYIQCPIVRMQRAAGVKEPLEACNKVTQLWNAMCWLSAQPREQRNMKKSPLST